MEGEEEEEEMDMGGRDKQDRETTLPPNPLSSSPISIGCLFRSQDLVFMCTSYASTWRVLFIKSKYGIDPGRLHFAIGDCANKRGRKVCVQKIAPNF
ncbi:hypothetical protein CEXT_594161 [Caerostris extrusa]|uniref:Uncharacterized protein n=1 Tax=Caerostris extrusa TaxID=172846 RepID=A0AAV4SY53_CAEEX|nr:hypothetical protein CEXT_594161 [Caerostris extrusa]